MESKELVEAEERAHESQEKRKRDGALGIGGGRHF